MAQAIACRVLASNRAFVTKRYSVSHTGVDLVSVNLLGKCTMSWITAHSDGTVIYVDSKGTTNYGITVKIRHDNGWATMYAHLKTGTVKVAVGDKVHKGDKIGYMGKTGKSTGAHLHFTVWDDNNKTRDAEKYIDSDLTDEVPFRPQVGDTVRFVGCRQYTNSGQDEAKAKHAIPCEAKVKRIYKLGIAKHPYSVKGTGVNGWVDADDITKLEDTK